MLDSVQTRISKAQNAGLSEKTATLDPVPTGTRAWREPRRLAELHHHGIQAGYNKHPEAAMMVRNNVPPWHELLNC